MFNITLAEMDRAHDERVQDFQKGTKDFLDAQIAYHEKVIDIVIELNSHASFYPLMQVQQLWSDFRMKNMHSPPILLAIPFLLTFFLPFLCSFFSSFLCLFSLCMIDAGTFEAGTHSIRPPILRQPRQLATVQIQI